MLRELLWKIFETTGRIDSYIIYREVEERNSAQSQQNMAEAEAATGSSPA